MRTCQHCYVSMHSCKVEDHMLICLKVRQSDSLSLDYRTDLQAPAPCLNSQYGCEALIRRDRLSEHLEVCPASTVSCCYVWNREFLDAGMKKKLKRRVAMGQFTPETSEADLDIQLALNDQRNVEKFFTCRRDFRRRQRDGRAPINLNKMSSSEIEHYLKKPKSPADPDQASDKWVDSSEEEEREMVSVILFRV